MSDGVFFDKRSAQRISDAVKRVEQRDQGGGAVGMHRGTIIPGPLIGKITSDMADGATANVQILEGAVGSESVPGTPWTVSAHNFTNRKLWANSYVLLIWPTVEGSGGKWRIFWSDSATRIRGRADVAIAAGASGTVDGLTILDGRVGPGSSVTAYNVLENFDVTDETIVFCEWSQAGDRWEIYAADCAP